MFYCVSEVVLGVSYSYVPQSDSIDLGGSDFFCLICLFYRGPI